MRNITNLLETFDACQTVAGRSVKWIATASPLAVPRATTTTEHACAAGTVNRRVTSPTTVLSPR